MDSSALPAPGAHAFLDESKQRTYVVTIALAPPGDLNVLRRALRAQLLPGQSAVHFKHERDGRKRQVLRAMLALPVIAMVYECDLPGQNRARQACLRALVDDLIQLKAERLVLEIAEGDLAADRRTLFEAVRASGQELRYDHVRPATEPMLWVSDAVAWAWCRNTQWRRQVAPLVAQVRKV